MKPQALQNAIKGLALKKRENRTTKGEWKDPYVKKYTITKEDYLREKQEAKMSPMARALAMPSAAAPTADPAMLSKMQSLLEQMQAEKYDWKKQRDGLLAEMQEMKSQMRSAGFKPTATASSSSRDDNGASSAEVASVRKEVKNLKDEVVKLSKSTKADIESLRREISSLSKSATSSASNSGASSSEIESLRREISSLRSAVSSVDGLKEQMAAIKATVATTTQSTKTELAELRRKSSTVPSSSTTSNGSSGREYQELKEEVEKLKASVATIDDLRKDLEKVKSKRSRSATPSRTGSENPSTPKTPGGKPTVDVTRTPLRSPHKRGSKISILPSCKPHKVQDISDFQRKDKALKEFLRSKGDGMPYSYKSMSVCDFPTLDGDTKHLVLFAEKLYIPKKLRAATMEHYCANHRFDAMTTMLKNCIWPNCEDEMKEYKKNRS